MEDSRVPVRRAAYRLLLTLGGSCWLAISSAHAQTVPQPVSGDPLPGLSPVERMLFERGREDFKTELTQDHGLGPAFNSTSCFGCHESPTLAGLITVTRFASDLSGSFDPLANIGGPVLQAKGLSPTCMEFDGRADRIPGIANIKTQRVTPPLVGNGLIEAIPDAAIIALEDPQDLDRNGVSGRAHRVHLLENPAVTRIGRFGWKAQLASVLSFSSDASLNEMGLTNEYLANETAPEGNLQKLAECDAVADIEDRPDEIGLPFIDSITYFQRFLAAPPQSPRRGMRGETLFQQVGCTACHTPEFTTSNDPGLEPALRNKVIRPYSDFLIHDMGSLGDRMVDGEASGVEMKTAPLWGLRDRPALLHDGTMRQISFDERVLGAIAAHFGEADASRTAFLSLSPANRVAVIDFLASLGRPDFDITDDGTVDFHDYALIARQALDADVTPDEAWAVADLNLDRRIGPDEMEALRIRAHMPLDCNSNGIPDWRDIAEGTSSDADSNGELDECQPTDCHLRVTRITGSGGAIPDLGMGLLTRTIPANSIPVSGAIRAIRVGLDIEHTWVFDLTVTLKRGGDSAIIVMARECSNFSDDLKGVYRFEDGATWDRGAPATKVCGGTRIDRGSGITNDERFIIQPGTYLPFGTLSPLNNKQLQATWTLTITDGRGTEIGTLHSWWLEILYEDTSANADDCNGNGIKDCREIDADPQTLDCNGNRLLDACEIRDNPSLDRWGIDGRADGILDSCNIAFGDVDDRDGNGVPDSLDTDSDGDGFPDPVDECPQNAFKVLAGDCGCGTADTDSDRDGTPDCEDACPNDPLKRDSAGACGCGNRDIDSDGDGTLDCNDECPNDPLKIRAGSCGCGTPDIDSDADGVPDCNDGCPNDPLKFAPGACGCGTPDLDSDSDGTPDCADGCPNDPVKTAPGPCGCGGSDADSDGDGTPNCNDACPNDPNKIDPGSCGCGKLDTPGCGDPSQIDSDLDGTPDGSDGCPNDPLKTNPGTCGCGSADLDSDGDSVPDCSDGCPQDPLKTSPGFCGCGQQDSDLNGNGVPDCDDFVAAPETVLRETSAGDGSNFGWYVALRGDRAIVGSPLLKSAGQTTGAARVLQRQVDGSWTPESLLIAPDGRADDWFGGRVDIDGDVAVVGAPSAQRDSGAVYVFRRNGLGNWLFEQKLQPAEVANFSRLGSAVAVRGNMIVAGAPFDRTQGSAQRGSVVVYRWTSATGWVLSQRLTANDGENGDRFGHSVSMRDGVLVVGAPYDDTGSMIDHGSCYLYALTPESGGTWAFDQKFGSPAARAGSLFGRDVSTDGVTIVANSPNELGGAAYAYRFAGRGQSMLPSALIAPDLDAADGFGSIVAVDGEYIVVGCRTDDVAGAADAGSTRVFRRAAGTWTHVDTLTSAPSTAGDQMGWGVAISGNRVLASATGNDLDGTDAGAVLVFDLSPTDCDDDGVPDLDTDGDGVSDCLDTDDDDDGTLDASDGCPKDLLKTAPGSCGCGKQDSTGDGDGDGIPDCSDNCPFNANPSQSDCNGDGIGDACDDVVDCNGNGTADICELASGSLTDLNGNGTPDVCEATTLQVPSSQYPTIQAALDAAPGGGTSSIVLVAPGTYIGTVNTRGKAVWLHAPGGPDVTILDGASVDGSLVVCSTGEGPNTVISGFTVRRGTRGTRIYPDDPSRTWRAGGGLYIRDASPIIRNCVFENCRAEFGGGVFAFYSGARFEHCWFDGNTSLDYGGGLQIVGGTVAMLDCSLTQNFAGVGGGGVHAVGGAIRLERCEILDNIALKGGGGISWDSYVTSIPILNQPIVVKDCEIRFNFAATSGGGARFWRYVLASNSEIDTPVPAVLSGTTICGNAPSEFAGSADDDGTNLVCVDCNLNGIPDIDDIAGNLALDCNQNGLIDTCELADQITPDRNANGIPDACESGTLFVPSEFGSIASAITAALPGDTVWIEAGVYREQINFAGKAITIRGAPGAVIDGSSATGPLLLAITGEGPNSVVDGLTFRSGRAGNLVGNPAIFQVGAGAHVDSASPTFRNCIFEDCRTQYGAGAYMRRYTGLIENCLFRLNNALEDGGGLQFFEGAATVRNCVFEQNICSRNGGAVHVVMGKHRFEDCTFKGNRALRVGSFGGGISWDGGIPSAGQVLGPLVLVNCVFEDNRTPDVSPDTTMSEGGGLFVAPATRNLPPAEIWGGKFCRNLPQDIKGRWIEKEIVEFCPPPCRADLDGNALTDFGDVNLCLLDFGPCPNCPSDLDGNGIIDFGDINLILLEFGPCQ